MRCPRFPTSDFGAAQCISNRKAKLVLTYSRQTPRVWYFGRSLMVWYFGRSLILFDRFLWLARSIHPNIGAKHLHNRPVVPFRLVGNALQRVDSTYADLELRIAFGVGFSKLRDRLAE